MKVISYATPSHRRYQVRLANNLQMLDIQSIEYNDEWLKRTTYYRENFTVFSYIKGGGYWAWKPAILLDALQRFPNEVILYLDASTILQRYPTGIDEIDKFICVETLFKNSDWTKRDCFYYMNCDTSEYWNANQIWAGVVAVTSKAIDIINEWMFYCKDLRVITDKPNVCGKPNLPGFKDHRHDQSILTNLVVKHHLSTIDTDIFVDK